MGNITESLDLENLKRILIVFSLTVVAAILADQIILSFQLKRAVSPKSRELVKWVVPESFPPLDPLAGYSEPIERRDLFNVNLKEPVNAGRQAALPNLTRNLRLIGIALFQQPEAIVEDARTGASVFIREKEKIGEITVEKIKPDSIVVSLADESEEINIKKGAVGDG